jgi:hypothetical protein
MDNLLRKSKNWCKFQIKKLAWGFKIRQVPPSPEILKLVKKIKEKQDELYSNNS